MARSYTPQNKGVPSSGIYDPENQVQNLFSPRMVLAWSQSSSDHITSQKQDIMIKTHKTSKAILLFYIKKSHVLAN